MREAKTLQADEIAAFRGRRSVFTAEEANRMFATIEQQQEHIEKLWKYVNHLHHCDAMQDGKCNCGFDEALAATGPKP